LKGPADWPTLKKYGLTPTMYPPGPGGNIPEALNRKENHEKLEPLMHAAIDEAKANGVPNIITFSGNRKTTPDAEGADNCVAFLNKVKAHAEDKGITICMEYLNSKVNHKDYMFDHIAWGVDVMKRVNSPRVKILYDIYHAQIMDGDIVRNIRDHFQWIGHFHTGGNPDRKEIDETQELNYRFIAQAIADLKFDGYVGHEYSPRNPANAVSSADVDVDGVGGQPVDGQDDRYVAAPAQTGRELKVDLVQPGKFTLRSSKSDRSVDPANGGMDVGETRVLAQARTE
jgi:hydroxypyruvate isomerase